MVSRIASRKAFRLWTVVNSGSSAELALLRTQLDIANRHGYSPTIYSNAANLTGISQHAIPAIDGPMEVRSGGRYGTALNVHIMMAVRQQLWREARHLTHHWLVEFDGDTVLLPWRLHAALLELDPSEPLVLGNGRGTWDQCPPSLEQVHRRAPPGHVDDECAVHGAITVFSSEGAARFLQGLPLCGEVLHMDRFGDDTWLGMCARLLGLQVRHVLQPWRLLVEHQAPPGERWFWQMSSTPHFVGVLPNCALPSVVAFHQFKYDRALIDCFLTALHSDTVGHARLRS